MNKLIILYVLSFLITVLFCWVIYPYKWVMKSNFNARKLNAIKKADILSSEKNKRVYVVQQGKQFIIGLRSEFRAKNSEIVSELRKRKKEYVDFDYRNAIIYKTK